MSTRLERVEELLRREIAAALLSDDLRDPRLHVPGGLSVTGVRVSADLSSARVYVDVLGDAVERKRVMRGLGGAARAISRILGDRVDLKRVPRLSFHADEAVAQGARIEAVLAELRQAPVPEGDPDAS
jgi:ribosome-binding factor A